MPRLPPVDDRHRSPGGTVDLNVLEAPVRLEFRSNVHALIPRVRATWRDCLAPAERPEDVVCEVVHVIALDSEETFEDGARILCAGDDDDATLTALASQVTVAGIEQRGGELIMLHGAVLADPATGRAVGFVAPSGTGKTTLCRTLGTAGHGWAYATDETIGLEPDGRVVPYPKPLSLLEDDLPSGVKRQRPVGDLGIPVADPDGLHLAALTLLQRDPDATEVSVEEVDVVDALAALAPETSYLSRWDQPLQVLVGLLAGVGGLKRLRYAECADLAPVVAALLAVPDEGAGG